MMASRARARLDHEMVRRGLSPTREQAQEAIAGGRVLVAGSLADKPSRLVSVSDPVQLQGPGPRFVSRGGDKLAAALDRFPIAVSGATALDAGASTGGFTDCLLQHGARTVIAVDVGHGQLDAGLRADRRVVVLERTNVRHVTLEAVRAVAGKEVAPVDLVTADLSFISLTKVVAVLAGPLVRPGGDLVVLVKPQFEVGRADASRGHGVIRDPALWQHALDAVASSLAAVGAAIMGAMRSPVTGAAGNTEFLVHAVAHATTRPTSATARVLTAAVSDASADGSPRAGGTAAR